MNNCPICSLHDFSDFCKGCGYMSERFKSFINDPSVDFNPDTQEVTVYAGNSKGQRVEEEVTKPNINDIYRQFLANEALAGLPGSGKCVVRFER